MLMFGLLLFLSLLLLILLCLLLLPFQFEIDSRRALIAFRWGRIGSASLLFSGEDLRLFVQLPMWRKSYSLLQPMIKKKGKKQELQKKKKRSGAFFKMTRKRIKRLLSSFKILKFRLNLDTDDYVLNAYLFPVFSLLSSRGTPQLGINFEGDFELQLLVENRLIRIIRAFIFK